MVTYLRSWSEGGVTGKERIARLLKITIGKADTNVYGDGTNLVPAAALGLSKVEECTNFVDSGQKLILAAPKTDQTIIQTYDLTQATDANRATVAGKFARIDASNDGVFIGVVRGY